MAGGAGDIDSSSTFPVSLLFIVMILAFFV